MTTSPAPPSSHPPVDRVPLRLRLHPEPGSGAHLDGAWWPQSRDLALEVADLVDHFPAESGRIQRLLFSPPDWDAAGAAGTRRVRATRGTVKVGSFPRDDTHLVILTLAPGERLHVLVVPSDHEPELADDLLARVPEHLGRDAHLLLGCRTR